MEQALELLGLFAVFTFMWGFGKAAFGAWRDARRHYRCPHIGKDNNPLHTIFHLVIGPIHVDVCSACMQVHRDAVNSAPIDERDLNPTTPVPESFRRAFEEKH